MVPFKIYAWKKYIYIRLSQEPDWLHPIPPKPRPLVATALLRALGLSLLLCRMGQGLCPVPAPGNTVKRGRMLQTWYRPGTRGTEVAAFPPGRPGARPEGQVQNGCDLALPLRRAGPPANTPCCFCFREKPAALLSRLSLTPTTRLGGCRCHSARPLWSRHRPQLPAAASPTRSAHCPPRGPGGRHGPRSQGEVQSSVPARRRDKYEPGEFPAQCKQRAGPAAQAAGRGRAGGTAGLGEWALGPRAQGARWCRRPPASERPARARGPAEAAPRGRAAEPWWPS